MAAAKQERKRVLTVTAALVVVKLNNSDRVYLSRGDVVPESVSQESIDHLAGLGYVSDNEN